jgi:hypothetical protein
LGKFAEGEEYLVTGKLEGNSLEILRELEGSLATITVEKFERIQLEC